MKIPEIKKYGDPVLKQKSALVTEFDKELRGLIILMKDFMYTNRGIGLAAPQLGISKRVIVADTGEGFRAFVNPKIIWSQGKQREEEGCLSIPGIRLEIKRANEIVLEGFDNKFEPVQTGALGIFARVLQHEIDHLDGILIVDRIPKKRLKTIRDELAVIKRDAVALSREQAAGLEGVEAEKVPCLLLKMNQKS
ncbi:MAG: peptide deformylase [Elusimicrobia bacterium RIFOXYA2_FULL_40_6]|nr:MAG: peptide deformylase [Elusimicrobia bacterium RIFOXYA2_FULL_40_6]